MFHSDEDRGLAFVAGSIIALLLAILGQWAVAGAFGAVLLYAGVGLNVITTVLAPRIPKHSYAVPGGPLLLSCFFALCVGCIAFGWWGILYVFAGVAGFLLSHATRR